MPKSNLHLYLSRFNNMLTRSYKAYETHTHFREMNININIQRDCSELLIDTCSQVGRMSEKLTPYCNVILRGK